MSERDLQPFSQRALLGLIAVGAVAFLAMAYFMISGESAQSRRPASPTTTSRSAVGYRAFIELLERFGMATVAPSPNLSGASLRIVLNPKGPAELRQVLKSTSGPLLIVLPKWRAYAGTWQDRVSAVELVEERTVTALAREIADDAVLSRPSAIGNWHATNDIQGEPVLHRPQLVQAGKLCPLVEVPEGMLIARLCRRPSVVVLADPDLIANHGLWRDDNAVVAMSAVASLRKGSGPVVALEPAIELPPSRSVWRLALSAPFVLITLTALLTAGVAIWMAAMRFGPPVSPPADRLPGVHTLIDISARLLRSKADGQRLLRRYAELIALELGRRLRAPRHLQGAGEIGAWLDASRPRGATGLTFGELTHRIEALGERQPPTSGSVIVAAAALHHWREDLLNGR